MTRLNNFYKILFLIFIILAVYYPAIFAGHLYIDDMEMITRYKHSGIAGVWSRFIPGSGFYYRPLLALTFLFDKLVWDFSPSFMHLENIIIHAINTILVYLLSLKIFRDEKFRKYELPLLAALLFGIHPINTESINWISGRTDPLGTLFMLLSMLALISGKEKGHLGYILLSSFFMILGAMSKEMLIFIYPAAIILIMFWHYRDNRETWKRRMVQALVFSSPIIVGLAAYVISRWLHHQHYDRGLQLLLSKHLEIADVLRISLKVFGFYVKKLFFPLPLNFTIVSVPNTYIIAGIAALLGLYMAARMKTNYSLFLVAGALLIIPAILIAMMGVAWTPVAERYMYLPSVFFSIGITGIIFHYASKRHAVRIGMITLVTCLVPAVAITAQRNLLWQNQLALYEDCKKKSPKFAKINNEIAISLLDHKKLDEAEKYLKDNRKKVKNDEKFIINLARIHLDRGDIKGAHNIIMEKISDKNRASTNVLKMLAMIDEKNIFKTGVNETDRKAVTELINTYEIIYKRTGDPYQSYRAGQLSLAINDRTRAASFFTIAATRAPKDAFYKKAAIKLAGKMKVE